MKKLTPEEMKKILKERLKPSRYEHSLGVAETAVKLAERFGANKDKAYIAGLLHDAAREYPNESLADEADKRNIPYGDTERRLPLLLHAYIGAYRAQELYGVEDKEILQAIWRHTVGGKNMTTLDKIIYFADMIEPNRDYPGVKELRLYAQDHTLDETLLKALGESIIFVIEKRSPIHPDTIAAYNDILSLSA